MIGPRPTGRIDGVVLEIDGNSPLSVTVNGRPATLAIVNEDGNIVTSGEPVAREVEAVCVESYRNFLQHKGWLRVRTR